jgi:hypothetical protein
MGESYYTGVSSSWIVEPQKKEKKTKKEKENQGTKSGPLVGGFSAHLGVFETVREHLSFRFNCHL